MHRTPLARPVTWACFTRQTARTSSIPDACSCICGRSVLPWSFHNPVAVHRSLLAARYAAILIPSDGTPADAGDGHVGWLIMEVYLDFYELVIV
jgi:hypothetical protein